MSVDVIETTEGMTSWAMSANDGRITPPVWGRAAGTVCLACDFGVTWTEPATTMPNTTAAAINAEKESDRLMLLSIAKVLSPQVVPWRDNEETRFFGLSFRDLDRGAMARRRC